MAAVVGPAAAGEVPLDPLLLRGATVFDGVGRYPVVPVLGGRRPAFDLHMECRVACWIYMSLRSQTRDVVPPTAIVDEVQPR